MADEMLCAQSGKVMYESDKAAVRAAVGYKHRLRNRARRGKATATERQLEAYLCQYCDAWHLGHRRRDDDTTRKRATRPLWMTK